MSWELHRIITVDVDKKMSEIEREQTIANIYEEHGPMLLNLCHRYLRNREDAEDAFQDAMIKVYNNLHRFEKDGSFKSWVYTIFVNNAISEYRKKKNKHNYQLLEEIVDGPFFADQSDPELNAEELKWVLDKMPEQLKPIFGLYTQGYKYEEMAEMLELNINTCKSQLFRARHWLREKIVKISRI